MLRKFAISVKKASHISGFPLNKGLVIYPIFGFSTNTTSKHSIKATPFKSYKSDDKGDINPDLAHQKSNATKSILSRTLASCKEITPRPDILDEVYKETLEILINKLSDLSRGINKLQKRTSASSNSKGSVQEIDVYLPNKIITEKNLLADLDEIAKNLTKVYQVNENQILAYLQHYSHAVECCSRFEKFHEHTEFWNTLYRVIQNVVSREDSNLQKEKSILDFFMKATIRHKYYYKLKASKNKSLDFSQHVEQVDKIEKTLVDLIIKNKDLAGSVSTIIQMHQTSDELLPTFSSKLTNGLNKMDNSDDIAECLNRLKGLHTHENFADLYKKLTEIALKRAQMNLLSTDQISLVMSALAFSKGDLSEDSFNALWNNLSNNINVKKDKNFTWASICSLMTTLNLGTHFTEERSKFLQECALSAEQRTPETKPDLNKNMKAEDTNLTIEDMKANITMLHTISKDKQIDHKILKKILSPLQNNASKIPEFFHSSILLSSSKIIPRLSNSQLKDGLLELYNGVFNQFINKVNTAKTTELTKAFHTSCLLGALRPETYEKLAAEIQRKIKFFQPYDYAHILWGIAELQKHTATQNIETASLEECILKAFINSHKDISNDHFRSTVFVLKQAKALKSLIQIRGKLETELLNRANSLPFKDLTAMICWLHGAGLITQEFLVRMEPFVIKNIEQAQLRDLSLIMQTYINNHTRPTELFSILEDKLINLLKQYLSNKPILDADSLRYLAVMFNDAAKSKFDKKELMEKFEQFFKEYLDQFNMLEIIQIIDSLGTYLSSNVSLIKDLLQVLNERLQVKENKQILLDKNSNAKVRAFQLGMFTIESDYKHKINLKDYKEIYDMDRYLASKIDEIRLVQPYISPYQRFVTNILKEMGYHVEEEHPIGVFVVDIFIKPNTVVEMSGPYSYIYGTQTLTLKTQKRTRQLEKLGYKIVRIPATEWEEQQKSDNLKDYLRKKIES